MPDSPSTTPCVLVIADTGPVYELVGALSEPLPTTVVSKLEVLSSSGGDEAIELFAARKPHVVVVTATLETGDAKSLVDAIRGMVPRGEVGMVVVGDPAGGSIRYAADAKDLTPDRFVSRPMAPRTLRFAVASALEAVIVARSGQPPLPPLPAPPARKLEAAVAAAAPPEGAAAASGVGAAASSEGAAVGPAAASEVPAAAASSGSAAAPEPIAESGPEPGAAREAMRRRWEELADSMADSDDLDDLGEQGALAEEATPLPPPLELRSPGAAADPSAVALPQAWSPGTTAALPAPSWTGASDEPPVREPTLILRDPSELAPPAPPGPVAPAPPSVAAEPAAAQASEGSGRVAASQASEGSGRVAAAQASEGSGRVAAAHASEGSGRVVAAQPLSASGKIAAALMPEASGKLADAGRSPEAAGEPGRTGRGRGGEAAAGDPDRTARGRAPAAAQSVPAARPGTGPLGSPRRELTRTPSSGVPIMPRSPASGPIGELVPGSSRSARGASGGLSDFGADASSALLRPSVRGDLGMPFDDDIILGANPRGPDPRFEVVEEVPDPAPAAPSSTSDGRDFARQLRAKMSQMSQRLFPGAETPPPAPADLAPRHDHSTEIDLSSLGEEPPLAGMHENENELEARARARQEISPELVSAPGSWDSQVRERGLPDHGEIVRGVSDAPMLLARMFAGGSTGRIVFRRGDVETVVFFDQGRPVFASSSEARDRMGELLVREGKITAAQYERCQSMVAESGRRMGEILVDLGYLKRRELLPAVRRHVEDLVYALFGWDTGRYQIAAETQPSAERIRLSRHPAALILEGIRRKLNRTTLERLVGPPATVVEVADRERLGGIINMGDLSSEERAALSAFDGQTDLTAVARVAGVDVADVLPLAWGLSVLGLATARRPDTEAPEEGPALVGETDLAIDRERVRARWQLVTDADYFALIGVRRDATAFEIRRAYQAARRDFAADGFPPDLRVELARELDDIASVLDEAFRVLRDDRLRQAYLANLIE